MEFLLLDDRENLKLAIIRKLEQQYSFSERKDLKAFVFLQVLLKNII